MGQDSDGLTGIRPLRVLAPSVSAPREPFLATRKPFSTAYVMVEDMLQVFAERSDIPRPRVELTKVNLRKREGAGTRVEGWLYEEDLGICPIGLMRDLAAARVGGFGGVPGPPRRAGL